jgi:hypothetical protein
LVKYNLHIVAVQDVGWGKDSSEAASDYEFFCANGNADQLLETGFFVHKGNAYSVLVGKLEGERPLGDLGLDVRLILKCFLGEQDEKLWTKCTWIRIESGGGVF